MARFVAVAKVDELGSEQGLEVEHDGLILALFRDGDQIIAVDGMCPHQGGPLANGTRSGAVLTCPWHGWQFNLDSGQCLTARSVRLPRYAVRVEGSAIMVELP